VNASIRAGATIAAAAYLLVWSNCSPAEEKAKSESRFEKQQASESDVTLPLTLGRNVVPEGYSVGNFGIAAAISEDGLNVIRSLINPPVLGQWLEPFGKGELTLKAGVHADFRAFNRYSVFPENFAQLESRETQVEARVETFAPISGAIGESASFDNFLPVLIVQVRLINHSTRTQSVTLGYSFLAEKAKQEVESGTLRVNGLSNDEVHRALGPKQIWLMGVADGEKARRNAPMKRASGKNLSLDLTVTVEAGRARDVSFVIGVYDPRGYTSSRFSSRRSMQKYILEGLMSRAQPPKVEFQRGRLAQDHAEFISVLPRTGDPELDVYSRWFLSAAILLTKGVRSGDVLTMGYRELNQRDSFWTTGAHLIFWPALELKMLEESMASQLPNGQIPLTILPTIIRKNNIDGNEYFILRSSRYYRWYRNPLLLSQVLPHIKRAIKYLIALDTDHIGLPKQVSYWADWNDVPGAEGRTYAPHFDLLWLATLKNAQFLAIEAADTEFASRLGALYDKAYERINRDVADGGLWDRTRYVDRWKDGRETPYTLQDQTLGAIFGVISRGRLESIYSTLNSSNESPYGVRETYPYIPFFKQSYGEGEYHNGGIWPYMNCADAWGRFKNGHAADAERIIRKVGYNSLVRANGFTPGEFLNGETGHSTGFSIQGWDADCFSAIYFGALGLDRISAEELAVDVNLTTEHDFATNVRVPGGTLILTRRHGRMSVQKSLNYPLKVTLSAPPHLAEVRKRIPAATERQPH
jgi:glycogen debranching enzyme